MSNFNFETFREYRSGFRQHTISWAWWAAIMDNNPRVARPLYNPEMETPWDIPL